jgi:hypothetical protein
MVGSLKMNTILEYSTRVVQEGDRRCKKSTLNDLAYLTTLRIPLMNPRIEEGRAANKSPQQKFGYFLSISQQAVSANITKNLAVAIFKL